MTAMPEAGDQSILNVMLSIVGGIQDELCTADPDDIDSVPPQVMHDIIAMINSLAYVVEIMLMPGVRFDDPYETIMRQRLAPVKVYQIDNGHTLSVVQDDAVLE